jgi:hypothetical protein
MSQLVKKSVTWNDVRKGDRWPHEDSVAVDAVDKKQKWGTFTFVGNNIGATGNMEIRRRLDESVVVYREELTEEEAVKRRREMIREVLIDDLRSLLRRNPVQKLEDIVTDARQREATSGKPVIGVLDWSNLADVLQAQATYKIGIHINHALRRGTSPLNSSEYNGPELVEDATYDEIVDAYAAWYASDVDNGRMLNARVNPLSRSTSVLSNLLEDLDAWAVGEITSKFAWATAYEVVRNRAAELRKEWQAKR